MQQWLAFAWTAAPLRTRLGWGPWRSPSRVEQEEHWVWRIMVCGSHAGSRRRKRGRGKRGRPALAAACRFRKKQAIPGSMLAAAEVLLHP